jgi:hypothetical protein
MSASSRGGTRKITSYFAPVSLQEGDLVNPFASGPNASAESNARACLFVRAHKAGSRKGIKQQRRRPSDKLKVCLYIKQNMGCKRDIVGMKVLHEDIPASTINDWWAQFQADPYNKQRWEGPDTELRWPNKALGRPVSIPKVIVESMDSYFELFREQGLQVTRELARFVQRLCITIYPRHRYDADESVGPQSALHCGWSTLSWESGFQRIWQRQLVHICAYDLILRVL